MINAVGRDIPEEILEMTGKEVFQGNHYRDGYVYKKDGPYTKCVVNNTQSKLVANIHDVLVKCGIKDGMTLGFHHHFREGDYIVNMVMEEVHKMGIKDITICASSLGKAHDPIVPYIEDGTITNIQSSGVRGKIGEAISAGKLKGLAIMRSHGGRVRAIESGETRIDIAFIGTPTCDDYGNCRGIGGKSDCGVLSYAMVETVGHSVCKTADKGILLGHGRQQLFCVFIFRNKFGHFCRKFICKAHYNKEFPLYLRERIDHSC